MYKRQRGIQRNVFLREMLRAGTFPKKISEEINIMEQFRILNKQREDVESTLCLGPARPRTDPQSCLVLSVHPEDRPRPDVSSPRPSSGCDEPVVGLDPNPGTRPSPVLDTSQPSGPESMLRPRAPLDSSKRRPRRKSSAEVLKYLGLYEDVRFLSMHKSDTVPHSTKSRVTSEAELVPVYNKVLPEQIIQHFPEESDLEAVKFRRRPQVTKAIKRKLTRWDRMTYRPKTKRISLQGRSVNNPGSPCPRDTLVVEVRVYWPNYEKPKWMRMRPPPKLSQVIMMLGSQTLDQLRDKIKCTANDMIPNECSGNPSSVPSYTAKDVYKSGFIFINDVFYNDMRDPSNIDYSEVIRTWAMQNGVGQFEARNMESTKMVDLSLRLGCPYVYQHQGSCEHIVVITDVQLLNGSDSRFMADYPAVVYERCPRVKLCYMCARFPSEWVVTNCTRVPYNPTHYCERCFISYNYIDGKKVGEFQAYKMKGPFYVA